MVWSCIKLHATHEIMNAERVNNVPCVVWSCIKLHATYEIVNAERINNVPCVVWSCIKMHATSDGARFLTRAFLYQSVIGTRCEACTIKCPENKSAVDFPSVFNTSKIHRTFLFFF